MRFVRALGFAAVGPLACACASVSGLEDYSADPSLDQVTATDAALPDLSLIHI